MYHIVMGTSDNLYAILGILPTASKGDIKIAYRKKAVMYHPDKMKDGNDGEFKRISSAYRILGDEEKRKEYDSKRTPQSFKTDRSDQRGADLKISIKVETSDLANHTTKIIYISRKGPCKACEGTGSRVKKSETCTSCSGAGLEKIDLILGVRKNCKKCGGAGCTPKTPECSECQGRGLTQERLKQEIQLNPLSTDLIILPKAGNYKRGGEAGDLVIYLTIKDDPVYQIRGLNVKTKLHLSPAQATIGDKVKVNLFGEMIELTIPPGTQQGHLIEKESAGLTHLSKRGNFHARIHIEIPEFISDKEKRLYKKILKQEKEMVCQTI